MTTTAIAMQAAEPADEAGQLSCFVIGPIGDRDAPIDSAERKIYEDSYEVFENIIEPACNRFGLTPVRGDLIAAPGEITEQVFSYVLQSDVVIADLTGGNPNVMLELGLRYGTGKPTIQISEAGQLPFNVAHVRTIRFAQTTARMTKARKELEDALTAAIKQRVDPSVPARILAGIRLPGPPPVDGDDDTTDFDSEAPGLVEFFADLESRVGEMTLQLSEFGEVMNEIAQASEEFSSQLQAVDKPGSPKSASIPIFKEYARRVDEPAARMRALATGFAAGMNEIDSGMRSLAELIGNAPAGSEPHDIDGLRSQIAEIAQSAATDLIELGSVQQVFVWLKSASRDLRKPAGDIASAFKHFRAGLELFAKWDRLLGEATTSQTPVPAVARA